MHRSFIASVAVCSLATASGVGASSLYGVDFEVVIERGTVTGTFFGTMCFESDTFPVTADFFNPENSNLVLTFDFVSDSSGTPMSYSEMDDVQFGTQEHPEFKVGEGLNFRVIPIGTFDMPVGDLLEFSVDDDEFEVEFPLGIEGNSQTSTTFGDVSYSEVYLKGGGVVPTPTAAALGLAAIVGLVSIRRR
ncbi:MAG: hypothetical protein AAGI54_14515 [Planctomycetota bacterium]